MSAKYELKMHPLYATSVYATLCVCCGANQDPDNIEYFVQRQTADDPPTEYRFCGSLGFGGKFWRNNGQWYVTCYREDETPDIRARIKRANERLAEAYREQEAFWRLQNRFNTLLSAAPNVQQMPKDTNLDPEARKQAEEYANNMLALLKGMSREEYDAWRQRIADASSKIDYEGIELRIMEGNKS